VIYATVVYIRCYIRPKEPAVIPTQTKNPNSTRSLEPGGIEFKRTANGIIALQLKTHCCMLLLLRCSQKLWKAFD